MCEVRNLLYGGIRALYFGIGAPTVHKTHKSFSAIRTRSARESACIFSIT